MNKKIIKQANQTTDKFINRVVKSTSESYEVCNLYGVVIFLRKKFSSFLGFQSRRIILLLLVFLVLCTFYIGISHSSFWFQGLFWSALVSGIQTLEDAKFQTTPHMQNREGEALSFSTIFLVYRGRHSLGNYKGCFYQMYSVSCSSIFGLWSQILYLETLQSYCWHVDMFKTRYLDNRFY